VADPTRIAVPGVGVLTFDPADVVTCDVNVARPPRFAGDDGRGNAVHEPGDVALTLHITFKPGASPRWTEGE
jgi:hypothetical protein